MKALRKPIDKVWVFGAATALIAGSSLAMTMILGSVSATASTKIIPVTNSGSPTAQPRTAVGYSKGGPQVAGEYTVIDRSKTVYENKDKLMEKLSFRGISQEQIEKECNAILSKQIPGEKDITAEEAAAYGAAAVKQAFGVKLNGYIADASFMKSDVPNSDTWGVSFYPADKSQKEPSKFYSVDINSVNGTITSALGFYSRTFNEGGNVNLNDPAWEKKALQLVSKLLQKGVSISKSRVVASGQDVGVTVLCELSNGTAYGVRMTGKNKEAEAFMFFPKGYDGSLDTKLAANPQG